MPAIPRPLASVDVVAFSVFEQALYVLLVRRPKARGEPFPGRQALPGGFIDVAIDVDLVSCARRKLRDKTARGSLYLEQLGSLGGVARDPRGWSATHAYLALLPKEGALSGTDSAAGAAEWRRVDEVLRKGGLAFDHLEILVELRQDQAPARGDDLAGRQPAADDHEVAILLGHGDRPAFKLRLPLRGGRGLR